MFYPTWNLPFCLLVTGLYVKGMKKDVLHVFLGALFHPKAFTS